MLNALLTGLFKVIISVLKFISDILLSPLTLIINAILPDFGNFTAQANNFINDYILKAIACGREILLNLTGFPQELLTISVNLTLGIMTYIGTLKVIAFVKNIWRTFKGGN